MNYTGVGFGGSCKGGWSGMGHAGVRWGRVGHAGVG